MVNFDHTEAGLTSKWGRISPAVQWCYQNQSNCIIQRCTTSGNVAKKFVTHTETLGTDTQAAMGQNILSSKVALAKN